jgi:hypothetical protein
MTYLIIFWGNSKNSTKMFKIQKGVIKIITESKNMDSYRDIFKNITVSLTIHTVTPIICGRQQKHEPVKF